MTKVHVVPRKNGKWAVKKARSSRASSTHRKKSAAVRKGKRMAKPRGTLKIHKRDNSIQDVRNY